jgi:alpha-L-fucosidase
VSEPWFAGARLGMFVHWGLASVHGCELSWPLIGTAMPALPSSQPIAVDDYYAAAEKFRPEPGSSRAWMREASAAGMTYAVLTTKHHEGYALWPSAHTDFHHDRDLVAEFADAARDEGLRVGFYFSLPDWHDPDYPAMQQGEGGYVAHVLRRSSPEAWARFLDRMFGQVRELLTNYGAVDVLWFDGGWERTADEWRADELRAMIRELQPGCLVNDRLPGHGDFDTPEQLVPAVPPARAWETCLTMTRSWGYVPDAHDYKSPTSLVHSVCEVAGRGGNLLLNVSPGPDGQLPAEQISRLSALGTWMSAHAEAIHGTAAGLEPWQFYGPTTRSGDRVYLHLLARPYESVTVRGVRVRRVRAVTHVASGTPLGWQPRLAAADELGLAGDPVGEIVVEVPDECIDDHATVIALDL